LNGSRKEPSDNTGFLAKGIIPPALSHFSAPLAEDYHRHTQGHSPAPKASNAKIRIETRWEVPGFGAQNAAASDRRLMGTSLPADADQVVGGTRDVTLQLLPRELQADY